MKKQTFLVAVLLLILASCQRKQTWLCSIQQNTQPNGVISDHTHTVSIYDTRSGMQQYEKDNTWVKTTGIITVTQTTTCR